MGSIIHGVDGIIHRAAVISAIVHARTAGMDVVVFDIIQHRAPHAATIVDISMAIAAGHTPRNTLSHHSSSFPVLVLMQQRYE